MTVANVSGALAHPGGEIEWARLLDGVPAPVAARFRESDAPERKLVAAWLRSVRSPNTRAAYVGDIDQFFGWCTDAGVHPFVARRSDIDRYAGWLDGPQPSSRTGRYGNATQARKLTAVSSFFTYAVDEGLLRDNPAKKAPRPRVSRRSTTRHLREHEADQLLEVAADHSPRALAIIDLMLSTGLRISEVVKAGLEDLTRDGDDLMLRVTRKGGEDETVLIPAGTAKALGEYLDGRRAGPLFPSDRTGAAPTRQAVGHLVALLARRAGLVDLDVGDRLVSPHSLRHTAATTALNHPDLGVREVQAMLGHADPRTTMRYDGDHDEVAKAAARALGGVWHRER